VVIHNLYGFGARTRPSETHTELIVYADAMLSRAITFQCLESVARRHAQILQSCRDLQLSKLSAGNRFYA
jgi:hypothetical protein